MKYKDCHMGVCVNGGLCLVDIEKDNYDYLTGDGLSDWHYRLGGSLSVREWFGEGSIVLPNEYLL